MKNTMGCKLIGWEDDTFKMEDVDPSAPSNVVKAVNRLHEQWLLTHPDATQNLAKSSNIERFFNRAKVAGGIVEATAKDDTFYRRLEGGFVNDLYHNILAKFDGTENTMRQYITDLDRNAKGYIFSEFERLEVGKKAKILNSEVNTTLDELGIRGADKSQILYRLQENAAFPYLIDYSLGASPSGQILLTNKQRQTFEYLNRLGIDDAHIKHLHEVATDLVQSQYEVAAVAKSVGVDVEKVLATDYLPRILTPEANKVLSLMVSKEDESLFKSLTDSPTAWLNKSRNVNILIPSDIDTLDYLFERGGVFSRLNDSDAVKAVLSTRGEASVTSVKQMLKSDSEPIILEAFLNQLKPGELDFLQETGLLAKVPVQTGQLYDQLLSHYKLPFEGLDDVFKYDPVTASQVYRDALTELASEKGKVYGFINGAVEKFGIPLDVAKADAKYASYKSLSEAFPDSVIKRLGSDSSISEALESTFVHPKAAQLIRASFNHQVDPIRTGIIGDLLSFVRKTSAGMMLGSPQMFSRNIIQNAVWLESFGIHPNEFVKYVGSMVWNDSKSLITKQSSDFAASLTDRKIWAGGTVSPKEAWTRAQRKGLINMSTQFGEGDTKDISINGIKRTLREMDYIRNAYPEHFTTKYVAGKIIKGANAAVDATLFKYVSYVNRVTDNATKFAMLEQVMNPNRLDHIIGNGLFEVTPYISDIDKAIGWVKNHSFMFDDLPKNSEAFDIATSVMPFWAFQYKAFQQTGRYLVEHPARFNTYLRIVGKVNDDFKEDYPVEAYGMTPPWANQFTPKIPFRIPKEVSGTGRDEFFMWSITGLVAQFGSIDTVNMLLDDLGLFNGTKTPSNRNDNPYSQDKIGTLRKVFGDLASPLLTTALSMYSGTNEYGQTLEDMSNVNKQRTLFGIPISQKSYWFTTSIFPAIKSLDRLSSYTGITGEAPYTDLTSGKFTQGQPSWTGTVPGYLQGNQKPNVFGLLTPVTDLLALNPQHIDVYYQLGQSKRQNLEMMISDATKEAKGLRYKLANATSKEQAQEIRTEFQKHALFAWYLGTEWDIVNTWAKRQGIPSTRAIRNIIHDNLVISDLLPRDEVDRISMQNYAKWSDNPYVNRY